MRRHDKKRIIVLNQRLEKNLKSKVVLKENKEPKLLKRN